MGVFTRLFPEKFKLEGKTDLEYRWHPSIDWGPRLHEKGIMRKKNEKSS